MNTTPEQIESEIILVEQPTLSQRCPRCNAFVKGSNNAMDEQVLLQPIYQIQTILQKEDGRTFAQVRASFQHRCPLPKPAPISSVAQAA